MASSIGLILCLILNPILISKYNYYGAALASTICYTVISACLYIEFCYTHHLSFLSIFKLDTNKINEFLKLKTNNL